MSPVILLLIPAGLLSCFLSLIALWVLAPMLLGTGTGAKGKTAKGTSTAGKNASKGTAGSAGSGSIPCDKLARPGWEYTRRVQNGKKWQCPSGFTDNGCTWADGSQYGELQCKRKVSEGEWVSPDYGGPGGKPFDDRCVKGHYVSGITLFHGERDSNAIFAQCYDPQGVTQPYNLFKTSSGVQGKHDTPGGPADWARVIAGAGMGIFGGSTARKTHNYAMVTDSIQGFHRWEVKSKKSKSGTRNEVQGMKLYSKDGRDTGWAGGSSKYDDILELHTGQCPPGKVITGIGGKAGDRLDSIKFYCDAPQI